MQNNQSRCSVQVLLYWSPSVLVKPHDLAVLVYVHVSAGRIRRKAGHGQHGATERVDEARARREAHVTHGEGVACGATLPLRLVGEGKVGLGHADRQVAVAHLRVEG